MSVKLDRVVPWGRSFDEYRLMFDMSEADLGGRILGCGDGPASFNAEARVRGGRVVSCDPIYSLSPGQIRQRFEQSVEPIMSQVRAKIENYVWTYHADPEELLSARRAATSAFLADYDIGRRQGRYLVGELPALPFADGQFDLSVCSHLLFLYSDLLDLAFHQAAVKELCRVSREVRIFPLTDLSCEWSAHVMPLREHLERQGLIVDVIRVNYQLQRNGDRMMRVGRSM